MERRSQGKRAQGTLGFRSSKKLLQQQQKGLTSDGKKRHLPSQLEGSVQQTWPPAHDSKLLDKAVKEKLPEKLMLLEELYHSMEAAISLLRIRRSMCTFSTIAAAVESSTQRRFLRSHLAQMKHILPEALQIEEHISWDAESQCSSRDLRITLLPISNSEGSSVQRFKSPQKSTDMVQRRQEFHSRLLSFHRENKETATDVPQASMFDVVLSSCLVAQSVEPPKPSHKNFEDLQEERKICKTNEQAEASQLDYVEVLNTTLADDECDLSPLPVAFHMSQLKKYPRSPSKFPHQRRISSVPIHASMSHLPPIFKPHFSDKRQIDSAGLVRNNSSEKAPELVSGLGSVSAIRPHFSLKRCKKDVVPSIIPCTPQKMPIQAISPKNAVSSPLPAATTQTSSLMSPPAGSTAIHEPQCRTPAQSDCAVISSSFASPLFTTPASTPQQAVLTPSTIITPSIGPRSKEAEVVLPKRRKQAVIKSLRFGTPTKRGVYEIGCNEDAMHTPKRVNRQLPELKPSSIKQDFVDGGNVCSPTDNLEMVATAGQNHETKFVELTPMNSIDRLSASDVEILKCLPQALLSDVQAKERKQLQDVQSGLEQARRRQQLIAGLPKLFNMVRLLFQSGNRTVLTRKDLIKMVLSSHPEITDQGEITEQLQLLVDFAPEWISTNRSSAGDLIYRINKNANMRAVSKALVEAK